MGNEKTGEMGRLAAKLEGFLRFIGLKQFNDHFSRLNLIEPAVKCNFDLARYGVTVFIFPGILYHIKQKNYYRLNTILARGYLNEDRNNRWRERLQGDP